MKSGPCLFGWKSEVKTGALIPLWYDCNQLPQSISKCPRASAHKKAQIQKTAVIDSDQYFY